MTISTSEVTYLGSLQRATEVEKSVLKKVGLQMRLASIKETQLPPSWDGRPHHCIVLRAIWPALRLSVSCEAFLLDAIAPTPVSGWVSQSVKSVSGYCCQILELGITFTELASLFVVVQFY